MGFNFSPFNRKKVGSFVDFLVYSEAVDRVVQEIRNNGGIAAPDYSNVIEGSKIVENCIKTFGRVDILINKRRVALIP